MNWIFLNFHAVLASNKTYMKCSVLGLSLLTATVVFSGCETPYGTPDRTGTGILAGGAGGAAIGAIAGGRHAGEGALIGGAIGAITGGLIGHSMDMDAAERERLQAQAPVTYQRIEERQPLAVADVKAMSAAKVSDDVIINQIQSTRTIYHLSAADIIDLHNSNVSEKVIQYMINTPNTASAAAAPAPQADTATEAPPAPPVETVVPAPGPGYVWVAGSWQWHGRWVWVNGYWAATPYPSAVWVAGYWRRDPWGWHYVPGHWR